MPPYVDQMNFVVICLQRYRYLAEFQDQRSGIFAKFKGFLYIAYKKAAQQGILADLNRLTKGSHVAATS